MSSTSKPILDIGYRYRHYPALSRFYGLSFVDLYSMPHWAMDLYINEMQGIEATEQLSRLQAADFPHIDAAARRKVHRQTLRLTGFEETAEKVDISKTATQKTLGGMGIRVVATPVRKKEEVTASA